MFDYCNEKVALLVNNRRFLFLSFVPVESVTYSEDGICTTLILCFLAVAVAVTWADRVIPSVAWIIPLSVAVSIFGALNCSMFTLGRLSYAGSQSGHLPVLISMLNVHSYTPAPAMIFSTTIASIFIIPSDLIMLTNYFGFSAWLMTGLTCASLIVLRYREPHLHRPYKVNGYKLKIFYKLVF